MILKKNIPLSILLKYFRRFGYNAPGNFGKNLNFGNEAEKLINARKKKRQLFVAASLFLLGTTITVPNPSYNGLFEALKLSLED